MCDPTLVHVLATIGAATIVILAAIGLVIVINAVADRT